MQKTGIIKHINPDGGYNSQNGYINTFQMTIECPDGTFTGQIGAKSATYPMNVGDEINVEAASGQHGMRFKKFNPQYANQNTQQPPQQAGGGQKKPEPDWDAIAEGKVRHGIVAAGIQSGQLTCANSLDVLTWTEFIISGKMGTRPNQAEQTFEQKYDINQQNRPQQNTDDVGDMPDDIPF